jgi:hypothetical protein
MAPDSFGEIRNAGYFVRYYWRGGRTSIGRTLRKQAILRMGLAVREAFNKSDDFEALLAAVADSLRSRDDPPF